MLVWEDAYKIGHPEMDAQHLVIFSLLNQITINIDADFSDKCVVDIVNSLKSYLRFHFDDEERVMRDAGYPDIDGHVEAHRQFVSTVDGLERMASTSGDSLRSALKIRATVLEWLLSHILEADVRYSRFISGRK